MEENCTNCIRKRHRTPEEKKDLDRRLKIIAGQINGISKMIESDRYCDDLLLQVALDFLIDNIGTDNNSFVIIIVAILWGAGEMVYYMVI